jgi:Crinkler effector protein N-terminal domain
MEVDEYLLELNFILLNGETVYKDATMAFKITLSSTANTWDIREAVQQKCTQCNVQFEDIRLDKLDVYKASLSPTESKAILQELKGGRRVTNSEWKTALLEDIDLLSDYFTEQPNKRAIHLIVDCTNAGELRATLRSW